MFCYKCGNQLEDDAVFCHFCGAKNDDEAENQSVVEVNNNYAPPRAKKSVPWKLIISSAVIAAVILVFAFGINRDRDNISTADISPGTNVVTTKYAKDNFSAEKITATAQTAVPTTTTVTTATAAPTTTATPAATAPVNQKVKIGDEMYDQNMTGELDLLKKNLTDSDIVNLQYMTNITELHLSFNDISDISPLSNLTNLKKLSFYGNNISDISSLSNLKNLKTLFLTNNNISDISSLSNLKNLKILDLTNNNISDLSAISELTKLESVWLDNNRISDLTPLSKCKLNNLSAPDNPLNGNLQALQGLNFKSYAMLDITNCGYEKYLLADENGEYYATSAEFDKAIQDNIQFDDNLILVVDSDGTFWGNTYN